MVLGDHVEVLRQRAVSDKARTLLYADHMPWAIEGFEASRLGAGPGFQERTWSLSV